METISNFWQSPFWRQHGAKICLGLAVSTLLVTLVYNGMHFKRAFDSKAADYAPQKLAPIARNNGAGYRINQVIGANLFGDSKPKPVVKVAPKTTLDLTLEGVLWASDGTMARAIIKSGNRGSKLYSVGEKIKGANVSVEEIRSSEVMLNRSGLIESLALKKTSNGGDIISYTSGSAIGASGNLSSSLQNASIDVTRESNSSGSNVRRGNPRKIKKPNFSGLDRALKKMGEI